MSESLSRADTFTRTGSSITHGALSPTFKSRNTLGQRQLKTQISLQEMIGNSETKWGIEGYKLPVHHLMQPNSPKYSMTKEADKRYMDMIVKRSEGLPDPCRYNKTVLWKGKLGVMKGGKRTTFLDEAIHKSSKWPSPSEYSPKKVFKNGNNCKFEKSGRISYLDDTRFLAGTTPAPISPSKEVILAKVKSAKILPLSNRDKKANWKIDKTELPAFNNSTFEELEKSTNMVKASQPKIVFTKSKRLLFTDDIIKAKKNSPSPDHYKSIDDSKIYKIMAKNRR